jgi:hypothetical protein
MKQSFKTLVSIEPRCITPKRSGIPTSPMNEVTFNHTSTKYCKYLTGFRYGADIGANIGDTFFSGAFLPQKWDDLPPFWPRFKLFQKHVSSYLTKEAKVALYWTHLHWCSHRLFSLLPFSVEFQLGIEPGSC